MAKPKPKNLKVKIDLVLEFMEDGLSVRNACEHAGISKTTFIDNVDTDRYARAKEARADYYFEKIRQMAMLTFDGKRKIDGKIELIDPQCAKVALDSLKWVVARMHIKYSEKANQESDQSSKSVLPLYNTLPQVLQNG